MKNIVKEMVDELTYPEMRELRRELEKRIKSEKKAIRLDPGRLLAPLKESVQFILGLPELDTHSRKHDQVVARIVVANILLENGCTLEVTGSLLGIDHTSVHYYSRLLQGWKQFPSVYEKELRIYKFVKGGTEL